MTPTRPPLLIVLALLAAVIGWCSVDLFDLLVGRAMPVPWTTAGTLLVLAAALFIWALLIRPRLIPEKGARRISPFVAARTAALAMAASRTGALVGGFYGGVAIAFMPEMANPFLKEKMWSSLGSVASATLLVLAALWLERICRLPDPPETQVDSSPGRDVEGDGVDWVYPTVAGTRGHQR